MSPPPLSPYRLGKAREAFNVHSVFNALSWSMMVGSIITLFAIRLGASSTYIGTLTALLYAALFFLPLGRVFARKIRIISIFSVAWIVRSIGMIPTILAPIAVHMGHENMALGLVMLGVAIFHVTRGIGMVGHTPVVSFLASGPDRGSYMTQLQIINSAAGMVCGFAIAILLGREPPLFLYSVIMALGIVCGITSGVMLRKVPEPANETGIEKMRLTDTFREAFSQPSIRLFLFIFMIVAMVSGVSRTFLVVYAREVFRQDDGMVLLYSVFGGLGHLLIGIMVKFFVDRIGAKPLFIICVMLGLVTMIPIVFFPRSALDNLTMSILFLALLFFMLNFGFLGSEGVAQTYFMGLVPQNKMLDMGILYFMVFGIAGAGGAMLAGLLLDGLALVGLSSFASFKVLFALITVLTGIAVFMQRKLTSLGALPLSGAVRIMLSYRDLQAISLLDRLDRSQDFHEQEQLLDALHRSPSQLSIKGLLERAKSPRLSTRMEAISALERLDSLNEAAEKALINDIVNNPFTTAYISARILGNHGYTPAIPVLRELSSSSDYMLAGEAMIALARLRDSAFRPQIEEIVVNTKNPRLQIMGVESLGIYRSPDSLGILVEMLKAPSPPPHLHDGVLLAISEILGIQNQFSRNLVRLLAEPSLATALAMDAVETASEFFTTTHAGIKAGRKGGKLSPLTEHVKIVGSAVSALVRDNDPVPLSQWILGIPDSAFSSDPSFKMVQGVFSQALLDSPTSANGYFGLLVVHWVAHKIRAWKKRVGG